MSWGITQEHIDGMIEQGAIDMTNVFTTIDNVTISPDVPQAFRDEKLQWVMNHAWLTAWAKFLGGRLPTIEEMKEIYQRIPWECVNAKCNNAWIEFIGYFYAGDRGFKYVGGWAFLMSSSEYSDGFFKGLYLGRDCREAGEYWDNREHGFSSLVVFG